MNPRVNHETANDPHPVEQDVSIDVGGTLFKFTLIVPRYVWEKLTPEDWLQAGAQLPKERDRHVTMAVLSGDYFTGAGMQRVRDLIRQSMCDLIYERFKEFQIRAGNDAWEVPATLQRAS